MSQTATYGSAQSAAEVRAAAPLSVRAGLASLLGGAVCVALGRIMTIDGGSPAQRLHEATGQDVRMTASIVLAVLGFAALIPGFVVVAAQVRQRGAVLAVFGSPLTVIGSIGFAVLVAVDATTVAATHVTSSGAMQQLLHQLDLSPAILALTPLAVGGYFFGPFLVTLSARRAGFVPVWLPFGVLGCLLLQPLGVAIGGPSLGHVVDSAFQLVFIALTVVLARATLAAATRTASDEVVGRVPQPVVQQRQQPGTVANV